MNAPSRAIIPAFGHFHPVTVVLLLLSSSVLARATIPAIFSFGDSYLDVGTTRFNPRAGYHSNFPPYGQNYSVGSGRFSNGKLVVDYLAEILGIRQAKPFLMPSKATKHGVNFASAGTAIDPGINNGKTITMQSQIMQFAEYYKHHNKSRVFFHGLFAIDVGTEDYIHYFRVGLSRFLTQDQIVAQVTQNITNYITTLNQISGARKFLIMGMKPLGCLPEVRFTNGVSNNCKSGMNQLASKHDTAMIAKMAILRKTRNLPYILYARQFDLINSATTTGAAKSGVSNWRQPCCSVKTPNNQMVQCGKSAVIGGKTYHASACTNPGSYAWWDYRNPTQALNALVANAVLTGGKGLIYPVNVSRLATF